MLARQQCTAWPFSDEMVYASIGRMIMKGKNLFHAKIFRPIKPLGLLTVDILFSVAFLMYCLGLECYELMIVGA